MQKSHFWVFNLEKCRHMFTQKPVHDCLWKVYSKLEIMSLRVNGLTICVISTQWNTAQYYKGRNHWFIQQFDESLCWMKEPSSKGYILYGTIYSWPLDNAGLNCTGPHIHVFFTKYLLHDPQLAEFEEQTMNMKG